MATFDDYKDRIIAGESGGDPNALYGYRKGYGTPTDMTFGEVFYDLASPTGAYAQSVKNEIGHTATPVGLYQIVGQTGRDVMERHGIDPNMPFTPENQEMMARIIFDEQGPGAWEALKKGGKMSARDHINGFDQMLKFEAEPMPERYKWARVMGNVGQQLQAMGTGRGLPQMLQGDLLYKQAEKRHGRNQTADYLNKIGRGDLASAVASGEMSGSAAMNLMYQYGTQGGGNVTYSTKPQMFTDPETGETYTGVLGDDGSIKRVDGQLQTKVKREVDKHTGTVRYVDQYGKEVNLHDGGYEDYLRREGETQYRGRVDLYESIVPQLHELSKHPAIADALGALEGNIDLNSPAVIKLSPAAREFVTIHDNIVNKIFMEQFQLLKGAGAITEAEGRAARDAMNTLNRSLDPEQYRRALARLENEMDRLIQKADKRRNGIPTEYERNPLDKEKKPDAPEIVNPDDVEVN